MIKVLRSWFHKYFSDEEAVILLLLLVLVLALVINFGSALAPVLASLVIAYVLQGVVARLKRLGMPHLAATIVVFLIFLSLTLASIFLLLPLLFSQTTELVKELPKMLSGAQAQIDQLALRYPEYLSKEQIGEFYRQIATEASAMGQWVVSSISSSIPALIGILIYAVLVPILVFFMLKDRDLLVGWLSRRLPAKRKLMNTIWTEANQQFANYIRGKVLEIVIVGAATYVAFVLMGVNYAALLALLVGLSVVVPYVGAAVVTIPVALVSIFQFGWGSEFIWVMTVYGIIQALDGNVLVPLLFSEVVNLHPVVIIVSVLFFGAMWGLWGVFFAIPLATLLKAIISAWPTAPLAYDGNITTEI
ncbi:AI-2E family transporter [Allohahella sp. A8]|uniref:AI-2E family transporter n=1 Tax=Allohahella sp. A8 TaxID=3141461 RepID=UPI000C096675|nr:AI-2E family transporter [Hahellaceae bacterium]|tara:strand:- start:51025 stop:52107 length:1083 start_codon:yes stop_codon:yes gene_type:complete